MDSKVRLRTFAVVLIAFLAVLTVVAFANADMLRRRFFGNTETNEEAGPEQEKAVKNGNLIPAPGRNEGEVLRVYLLDRFAGMAQADGNGQARFRAMLWENDGQ